MVLDDLGLVPTLRRGARDRARKLQVPVEFESLGHERRLPMDLESAIFRIVDESLAAYLGLGPERIVVQLDWGEQLEARVSASRTPAALKDELLPDVPGGDVPDAIKQIIQNRHDRRQGRADAAAQSAVVVLPAATRRDVTE